MRITIILISLFSVYNSLGQSLVDKFGYFSTFCSGTFYLYSDSSFVFESGCEERSSITIGTYNFKKDSILFYPKRLNELDLIKEVQYLNIDSTSTFTTTYSSMDDSIVKADAKYVLSDVARKWIMKTIDTDSLKDDRSLIFDTNRWAYIRTSKITLNSCPIELERLLNHRLTFPLVPETNEIRIRLSLPYHILVQMINYEMVYEDMETKSYNIDNRKIRIIYL